MAFCSVVRYCAFGSRLRMAFLAIAPLEVACGWLFSLLRLWKSLADDFRAVAPLEVVCEWFFGLLRLWKSLADDFCAVAPLEVVCE
jgi:hypothetical protein